MHTHTQIHIHAEEFNKRRSVTSNDDHQDVYAFIMQTCIHIHLHTYMQRNLTVASNNIYAFITHT